MINGERLFVFSGEVCTVMSRPVVRRDTGDTERTKLIAFHVVPLLEVPSVSALAALLPLPG